MHIMKAYKEAELQSQNTEILYRTFSASWGLKSLFLFVTQVEILYSTMVFLKEGAKQYIFQTPECLCKSSSP